MKFLPIIVLLTLAAATQTHGKSVLNRLSRSDLNDRVQIYVSFNDGVRFAQRISNKRLDITFFDTDIADEMSELATDDIIVKSLLRPRRHNTDLSLFFRYIPQNVVVSEGEANTVVIDVIPGNRFTSTYQDLADTLGAMYVVSRNRPYPANPLDQSPYRNNWAAFFTTYQSYPVITPPLSVFIPPFPWIDLAAPENSVLDGYPSTLIDTLHEQDWLGSLTLIQNALTSSSADSGKQYLALLHAEILFRLGNINTASDQLRLIRDTYAHEPVGLVARYIHHLIEARKGDYHLAQAGLKRLLHAVPGAHPLTPFLNLSLIETGLALNQTEYVTELLAKTLSGNDRIRQRLLLRSADASLKQDRYTEALRQYEEVKQESDINGLPFALNGYCISLLENLRYDRSSDCYQNLANALTDEEMRSAAYYMSAMALQPQSSPDAVYTLLDRIVEEYPRTESALRSEMKQIDGCIGTDTRCLDTGAAIYDRLSRTVHNRELRSETWFKKALLMHLNGTDRACVEELITWLRVFQSGDIQRHARALLVDLLPDVIGDLLVQGSDMEAVILARRTKRVFENRWLDFSVLFSLVPAFERLGLYREAIELLLFLRNEHEPSAQQEIYRSLTRLAHQLGDVKLVEDFSSQYFHQFPNGPFTDDIRYFRIDSVYASGRIDEAEALLPDPLPERTDFMFLAASIYFHRDLFAQCAELLGPMHKGLLPDSHIFLLAESLHELGRTDEAARYFSLIEDIPEYRDISLYRTYQNEQNGEMTAAGINQLKHIMRSSGDEQWQRFAAQNLRYVHMMEML